MFKYYLLCILLIVKSADAMPRITVTHQRNAEGFAEVKVVNKTFEKLICYIAIDGHKLFFTLTGLGHSNWHTATDKRYNHRNFSIWCDYISLYPQYNK